MECNCSDNQVNAKVARLNALVTFALALIFLVTPYGWVCYLLLVDFFIKGAFHPKFSPVSRLNGWILRIFEEKPRLIFAPPKLFANKVGLAFSIIISIYYASGHSLRAGVFAIILALFAFLEFAFEFCMGCWVYNLYHKVAPPAEIKK
jgi:hypothetical protein